MKNFQLVARKAVSRFILLSSVYEKVQATILLHMQSWITDLAVFPQKKSIIVLL